MFIASTFTFVLSENVFCQDMVVLLNPACVLLFGMLHVYKSNISVAVCEKDVFPKRSADNVTRHIFSTLLHRMFVALLISKHLRNSASLTFLTCYSD